MGRAGADRRPRLPSRPCFVNFRTTDEDILALVDEVARIGRELAGRR